VIPSEEYWIRSGAKPKFTSQIHGSLSPPVKSKEQGTTYFLNVFLFLTNIQNNDTTQQAYDIWIRFEDNKPNSHCSDIVLTDRYFIILGCISVLLKLRM